MIEVSSSRSTRSGGQTIPAGAHAEFRRGPILGLVLGVG
jgi:hypothetical protein